MATQSAFSTFMGLQAVAIQQNWKTASLRARKIEKITEEKPSKVYLSVTTKDGREFNVPCHRNITNAHKLTDIRIGVTADGELCAVLSESLDTVTF